MRILTTIFIIILTFGYVHSQCSIANPTLAYGNLFANPLNNWEYVDLYGSQGHDAFDFTGKKETIYVFTTLGELGGSGPGILSSDFQITIVDLNNQPVPGEYGRAFHDDVNFLQGEPDPLLIWSPIHDGNYRVLVTRYASGSCQELGVYDYARVAYRGFVTSSSHVSVWTGVANNDVDNPNNWVTTINTNQYTGKPSSSYGFQLLMDALPTARINTGLACEELFLGTRQLIELDQQAALEVTNRLFSPVQPLAGFWLGHAAGKIKSLDPTKAGKLILRGSPDDVVSVGQFRDIKLDLYSDFTLKHSGSLLVPPCRLKTIRSYTSTFTINHNVKVDVDGYIWLNQAQSRIVLKPHATLNLSDGSRFGGAITTSGGVRFEGGSIKWHCQNRFLRNIPFHTATGNKGTMGFEIDQNTSTIVDLNYFEYQSPSGNTVKSPLQKVSSKEYFTIQPDKAGLGGRIAFFWHAGSGIGTSSLNEITLAGMNVASEWEILPSSPSQGEVHAFPIQYDSWQRYTPASTGTSHSLRKASLKADFSFKLYPNPTTDFVHLRLSKEPSMGASVRVLSLDGREVLAKKLSGTQERIDLRMLAAGQYMVEMTNQKARVLKPLAIKK